METLFMPKREHNPSFYLEWEHGMVHSIIILVKNSKVEFMPMSYSSHSSMEENPSFDEEM